MDYVRESGASMARRRRRRRAAITLSVVAVLLLGGFAYAGAYFQGWIGKSAPSPTPTGTCAAPGAPLAPKSVALNVYNATDRNGLAAAVSSALRKQGFTIVSVSNDPLTRTIIGAGEIRHGKAGLAAAKLVVTRLRTAKMVQDARTDPSVDLVLGNAFKALTAPAKAAPAKPASAKTPSTPAAAATTPAC